MTYTVFGLVLLIIQIVMFSLMARRMLAVKSSSGVSMLGELVGASTNTGWIVHGFASGNPVLLASGAIGFFGTGSVGLIASKGKDTREKVASAIIALMIATVTFLFWYLLGSKGAAAVATFLGLVQYSPQFYTSTKDLIKGRPALGVSKPGALLRILFNALWVWWAFLAPKPDLPVIIWGVFGVITYFLQYLTGRRVTL